MADAKKIFLTKLLQEIRSRVLPMTPKQSDIVLNGLVRHPFGRKKTWNSKGPASRPCWYIFSTLKSEQKIRTREKNSKCRILQRGNWSPPEAHSMGSFSCVLLSRYFSLLHYNAPVHEAACLRIFYPQKVKTLYQPPYSADLSPPYYFLFPKLKMKLKGLHFADVPEIQEAVTVE
jgi:hypothetical protein